MMKGVAGKILVVDLTTGTWESQAVPEEVYRKYLGGYGLGAWYIYHHIKPGCDPIGPDNILGFTPGLLTGTGYGLTGRYSVCGKSPLTGKGTRSNGEECSGGWGNANSGGLFGPAIKRAGFDAIFFHGASQKPVYLLILGKKISLEDAGSIWGKDIVEMEAELKKRHGEHVHVAGIGEAGEKLSFISGIANDGGRIAARSGLGAVMGSKKLKAVCIDGTFKMEYADPPEMRRLTREYYPRVMRLRSVPVLKQSAPLFSYLGPLMRAMHFTVGSTPAAIVPAFYGVMMGQVGTISGNSLSPEVGDGPLKNYKGNSDEDFPLRQALKISANQVNKLKVQTYGCFSCPMRCGALLRYDRLPYEEKTMHRPEYETFASICSLLCIGDLDLGLQAGEYLNRAGMDSISAGVTVAYVLEAVEQGYFKKESFRCKEYPEGFLPRFGDPTYIMPLLRLMVTREGIGDKLADGTYMAALRFPGTKDWAMNVNGGETGMHDPRLSRSYAPAYVADPTPGRHTTGNYDGEAIGMYNFYPALKPHTAKAQNPYQNGLYSATPVKMWQVMESLGMCMFVFYYGDYHLEESIRAATGWEMKVEEILEIGGRIQTLRQMFNAREGAIRHEMPQRIMGSPPLKKGANKGVSLDPETMVQGYYRGLGFRQDGVPTEETLRAYGLDDLVPDLKDCTGAPERLVNEYLVMGGGRQKQKHTPAIGG